MMDCVLSIYCKCESVCVSFYMFIFIYECVNTLRWNCCIDVGTTIFTCKWLDCRKKNQRSLFNRFRSAPLLTVQCFYLTLFIYFFLANCPIKECSHSPYARISVESLVKLRDWKILPFSLIFFIYLFVYYVDMYVGLDLLCLMMSFVISILYSVYINDSLPFWF